MKAAAAALLLVALVITPWERAARHAEAGRLQEAEREYRELLAGDPGDLRARYNLGTILLRQGEYDEARRHLSVAADSASPLAGAASYNAGNTDLVPAAADPELSGRVERVRRAIDAYRSTLRRDPADADARWNLELARRLLEEETREEEEEESGGGGGGGGGGAGDREERAAPRPAPAPAGGAGRVPELTPAEAEALLQAAAEEEGRVQRERLRKPQPAGPIRP